MAGELGKASLDLEANLGPFIRNLKAGEAQAGGMRHSLDALAAVSKLAEDALQRVKMGTGQGAESDRAAGAIERSVGRVGRQAIIAADHLEQVKLSVGQAAETAVVGERIDATLEKTTRKANEARRAMEGVRLLGLLGGGGALRTTGRGVGPFGSGYGRIGAVGTLIGLGAVTAPAAGPGALGLLAGIPTLAAAGAGALGTLILAFQGVGKAIGGDLKAFKGLTEAQQQFVLKIRSLHGWIAGLKQTAASSMFPGLTGGLTAALSPGTLGQITSAVRQFGTAIGQAGLMWGRYFGSAQFQQIFGPLMHSGAQAFTTLSRAALSLFDALGVLGRAAIPFTNWLTSSMAKGAAWLSTYLRAKQATGGLSHALNEAQSSLRLVARLVEALWHAVYALGQVLYPVAKVAVKGLTDGLNALSGILHRNQSAIRSVIGTLLTGLFSAVKGAARGIAVLNDGLRQFVGNRATIITTIALIGTALAVALGPQSAAVFGVLLAIGLISKKWDAFKTFFGGVMKGLEGIAKIGIAGMLTAFAVLAAAAAKVFGWIPFLGPKIKHALEGVSSFVGDLMTSGNADIAAGATQAGAGLDTILGRNQSGLLGLGPAVGGAVNSALSNRKQTIPGLGAAADAGSPFGKQPAWTKNVPHPRKSKSRLGGLPLLEGETQLPLSVYGGMLIAQAGMQEGTKDLVAGRTGVNLLSDKARLAIARAKVTPDKADDLKALIGARTELQNMAKSARAWLRIPLAEEIGRLSTSINGMTGAADGFNLTLAEQKRHSLDARYADVYHARAGKHMTGTPGPAAVTYAPTIHTHDEAHQKREMRRDWFRFRQTVLAG